MREVPIYWPIHKGKKSKQTIRTFFTIKALLKCYEKGTIYICVHFFEIYPIISYFIIYLHQNSASW